MEIPRLRFSLAKIFRASLMCRLSPLFVLSVLILTACNGHELVALKPASTSREALLRAIDALDKRDEGALLALVDGGADAQDFFRSIVESEKSGDAFEKKFTEAYGKEAWQVMQGTRDGPNGAPHMRLILPDMEAIRTEATNWDATADNKGYFDFLPRLPIQFEKISGGWVINGGGLFKDRTTLREMTKSQNMLTTFIRKFMKAIGHKGISADDMDYQMGKDSMALLGIEFHVKGQRGPTNRFDIDHLKAE
jgi:hypothetical protein